ncbi:F-box protein CPR1-like [Salvia divinorum]|uniref:F-box protein CPR1-like n=1 Tax=Salvia divinorum TaxID=28513 RepID=A0ABD1HM86_SALDI
MGEDFFEYLPLEIEVNILSRLPTRAAMVCKCVCKSWRVLLATPEFVNSHMARSVPGIAVETRPKSYEVFEFVDELGFSFVEEYHREDSFNFELPFDEPFHSSVNGVWVERISCLDLETELFGTFSAPYPCDGKDYYPKTPCVLRDCLSLCNITNDFDIAIWSMKEYGDEKSWTKEVFNGESVKGDVVHACLVKVFENGDILMQFDRNTLFYYANETKTFYDYFTRDDLDEYISTILYAPSFLTLKNFVMENVSSF